MYPLGPAQPLIAHRRNHFAERRLDLQLPRFRFAGENDGVTANPGNVGFGETDDHFAVGERDRLRLDLQCAAL